MPVDFLGTPGKVPTMPTDPSLQPSATPPPLPEPAWPIAPPGLGKALLVCAVFYGLTIFATIVGESLKPILGIKPEPAVALFFELLFAWSGTLWLSIKLVNRSWNELYRVGVFRKSYLIPSILAAVGLSIVLSEAATLMPMSDFIKQFFLSLFSGNPFFVFLGVCLLAPVAEELFFRGFVLRSLLQRYSAHKAVLVSSLLFAVFHLNPWQAVVAFPIGVLNSWLLLRTGGLIAGMVVHVTVNFTSVFILFALGRLFGFSQQELIDRSHIPWQVMLVGVACGLVGLFWLFKLKPSPNPGA